ncbi:uncharacterized protein TNCT_219781 [Trichonephila clavata]|uniref:Uncharacterized protein n=1 Tax=Trichonephila clavata TaxID=2740835 RepID=A0A8X6EYZ7_TRICU|nr:uncharacterized protein TNCT_219781 [Trichonephila clavata]
MDFDRHRSRQKSAPGSDNDAKYYFSDVGDGGRSKAAKQLRRRKNLDDSDAKDGHKGKSFSSDKRELKYQRPDEKDKNFPDQFQLRSGEMLRRPYEVSFSQMRYFTEDIQNHSNKLLEQ